MTNVRSHSEIYTTRLLLDNHECQDCGSKEQLELHHILPRSQGGKNEIENLKTVCKKCHNENYNDVHYPKDKSKIIPVHEREKPLIGIDTTRFKRVMVYLDKDLAEQVIEYQHENHIPNRTQAIMRLIENALK